MNIHNNYKEIEAEYEQRVAPSSTMTHFFYELHF